MKHTVSLGHLAQSPCMLTSDSEPRRIIMQSSSLLSLPAELRKWIYEYALAERRSIKITPGLRTPALLRTSSQLRCEAHPIWFKVNPFKLVSMFQTPSLLDIRNPLTQLLPSQTMHNLDMSLGNAWTTNMCTSDATRPPKLDFADSHDWKNLLRWCRGFHRPQSREETALIPKSRTIILRPMEKKPTNRPTNRPTNPMRAIVSTAHAITRAHEGCSWEDCKKALDNHRIVIAVFDPQWKEDT